MVPKFGNTGRTEKRRPVRNGAAKRNGKFQRAEQGREKVRREEEFDVESEQQSDSGSDDEESGKPKQSAYSTLLQTFGTGNLESGRPQKRRKLSSSGTGQHVTKLNGEGGHQAPEEAVLQQVDGGIDGAGSVVDSEEEGGQSQDEVLESEESANEDEDDDAEDPYTAHFSTNDSLARRVKAAEEKKWKPTTTEKHRWKSVWQYPDAFDDNRQRKRYKSTKDLPLKQRLRDSTSSLDIPSSPETSDVLSTIFNYQSLLHGGRTPANGNFLRDITTLHALNHVLKGRDKVIRNNEKLAKLGDDVPDDLDVRDQGFTRPKVLVLLETREQCYKWVTSILKFFEPEQRENWTRFADAFHADDHIPEHMPEDYRDIFEGNSDNDFRIGIKFTRKTIKFFSAFYQSDILLCSPLGLRRIIASSDPKKSDHDFLSSIEIAILDQADAMLQQNWSHVTFVLSHLNLQPKDSHGADFTRVRPFYLDSLAPYLRQTLIFSSHLTPELQSLFSTSLNLSGRLKLTPLHPGAITSPLPVSVRQTFNRYDSPLPSSDPDSRFAFFTATLVPWLVKTASLSSSAGILVFIPSYLDFVRVRNFFASSPATESVSFGQVSEYTPVSDQRRARSHFQTGKNQVLLYSGRAHHFHRYRIRGVKRVVWYALPDNEKFWNEVNGWVGETVVEGKAGEGEVGVRAVFGKWDGLRLERVVGSERVGNMVRGEGGDVFDFV
ncbi:U3 small nucleolar RNA-associated protein 25-like protein [Elsinoe fawcettii]|nr:U3 small nucleolar RNA-associated protein 25-like protein [Elsinoe fawcettii]